MDRGTWWATVHGVTKESNTTEQLNNNVNKLLYNKQNPESNVETVLLSKTFIQILLIDLASFIRKKIQSHMFHSSHRVPSHL